MTIGGSNSSNIDEEYYANFILNVPYDSSGNVALNNKYQISLAWRKRIII